MATTSLKMVEQGSAQTIMSTELNSLANNTNVISSVANGSTGVITNTQGTSGYDGYPRAKAELNLGAPGGTLAAGSGISVWFLKIVDGSNYEDGGSSVTPARMPDVVFPVRAVSGAQRIIMECPVPVGTFKVLVRNDGTGQTLASSGNTLKLLLNTDQGV